MNEELFCMKISKIKFGEGVGSGGRGWGWVRVDVNGEWSIKVFVTIQKKIGGGSGLGGHGGFERRMEVFGKIKKKWGGGMGWVGVGEGWGSGWM